MTQAPLIDPELLPRLDAFMAPLMYGLPSRRERRLAQDYVHGLLGPGERKTVAPIAQRVRGEPSVPAFESRMRAMLNDESWSHAALISEGTQRLLRQEPGWTVLTLDDTALLKQGSHSVGVSNQYAGCVGGLANCQVVVTVGLAQEHVSAPCAARVFLPEAWCDDEKRRAECHVPSRLKYQAKWQLGLELLGRLQDEDVPKLPVLADSLYGDVTDFRLGLQRREWPYVVATSSSTKLWAPGTLFAVPPSPRAGGRPTKRLRPTAGQKPMKIAALAASMPQEAWQTVAWRYGSRGLQSGRFAAVRVRVSHGWNGTSVASEQLLDEETLLMHWPKDEPSPTKAWLSNLPADTPLNELIAYARLRWRIERDYQESKGLVGLDHYEGRTWYGLHHHVALVVLAHQFLALERARQIRLHELKQMPTPTDTPCDLNAPAACFSP